MIYNISVSCKVPSTTKLVEASSLHEAELIAQKTAEDWEKQLKKSDITVQGRAFVSDENYRYHGGAFYLVKRYSSEVPAKCISSRRKGRHWEHDFRYLDTGKRFMLRYKESVTVKRRVIKLLCENGKLSDDCDECPARFFCYTNKVK